MKRATSCSTTFYTMKKTVYLLIIMLLSLFSVNIIWANSWYVDPVDGDDSVLPIINDSDNPWETIKRALDHCSSGDTIELMDGDFVEAVWDTSYGGQGVWEDNDGGNWYLQISVDKSNVTLRKYSGNQSKPTIIGYNPTQDNLNYLMRIDNTYVKLQNIIVDGLYIDYTSIYLEVNDAIYITPDADNTEITYCEFTNFGNQWGDDP